MDRIGRRVDYFECKGTVLYYGPLLHKPKNAAVKPGGDWAGIVWDDPTRGNHNGVVDGVTYIEPVYGPKACSLVRAEKLNFGVDLLEAFVRKYFKNEEALQLLANKDSLADQLTAMANEVEHSKLAARATEFDEEAVIQTSINYKKIEFIGWERIWMHMKNLRNLENLSLSECTLSSLGHPGTVAKLFSGVKQFACESNLLDNWGQVADIQREFPKLETLWLCKNKLGVQKQYNSQESGPLHGLSLPPFQRLKSVFLLEMGLTWLKFCQVKQFFVNVEELGLSQNKLTDWENFSLTATDFPNLKKLDLAQNDLADSKQLSKICVLNLRKLNLSQNKLTDIPIGAALKSLTHLNLSGNAITDMAIVAQLTAFASLTNIHVYSNPFLQFHDKDHIRCLLIASIPKVKSLNGSTVERVDKRDSEIYYLKNAFHEYFRHSGTTALTYNLGQFYAWARPKYPLIDAFIAKMDNPYPVEDRLLEAPPNTAAPEVKVEKLTLKASGTTSQYATFKFFKREGESEKQVLSKTLPVNFDLGYLKTTVRNLLKLKTKISKVELRTESGTVELEGDLKKLAEFAGPQPEYHILLTY